MEFWEGDNLKKQMELINTIRNKGIGVKLDGDKMLLNAPKGAVDEQLLQQIKNHRQELIWYIKNLHREHSQIKKPGLGYSLSDAQEQLWTISKLDEDGNDYYNVVVTLKLEGKVNETILEASVTDLIRRHETLRTLFINTEEGPVQIVLDSKEIPFSFLRYSFRENEGATSFQQLVEEERAYHFNLEQGPLFRTHLIHMAEGYYHFVLSLQHIICDGISLNIIKRDLIELYQARLNGSNPALPPISFQYKDYVLLKNSGEYSIEKAKGFWERMYNDNIPYLNLPTDYKKSESYTFKGSAVQGLLKADALAGFKEMCRQQQCTLYEGLFALTTALMYLRSGQNDVVLGTLASGRSDACFNDVVGLFVNTLAVRTRFAPDQPFGQLLEKVKAQLREAQKYQDYSFSSLIRFLRSRFSGFTLPLFEVMVLLHNHTEAGKNFEVRGMKVEDLDFKTYNGNFPYTFNFTETHQGLDINLEYNTDLFREDTAAQLVEQFKVLLQSITERPYAPVKDMDYLKSHEKEELLAFFSGPLKPLPEGETFIDSFFRQCDKNPDKLALKYENKHYSYSELKVISINLANHLKANCIKSGKPIAIVADRSDQLVIGVLGILVASNGYVHIEPDLPQKRLEFMLDDIGVECVVAQSTYQHLVASAINKVIVLEQALEHAWSKHETTHTATASPDSLAYIIYTSGSTGTPKGTMIHHKGMLNHLLAKIEDLSLDSNSVIAQTASASFDISIWQMLAAFICGGTTVIYDNDVVNVPEELCKRLKQDTVTILEIVPSYMALLLQFGNADDFAHLRYLIATGEALPFSLLKSWLAEHPDIPMVNAYGPTEVSDDITHHIYDHVPEDQNISIGSPIRNLSIYVVDEYGTVMPVGVKGQIIVSGVGVGLGYFNNPEKTAKAFGTDNYFDHGCEQKTYATGDIGMWSSDGTLQFFGRMDDQVKVRGYRIELGEIEKNIARFEQVNQVAVSVRKNDRGGSLISFLTLKSNEGSPLSEIKSKLPEYLPDYMIPHSWVVLDKMPLTGNGKIDRKKLNQYQIEEHSATEADKKQEVTLSPVERKILQEWQHVLGGNISPAVSENFFEVGGDSFKAILLAAKLSKKFSVQLSIKDIFNKPTIAMQAGLVGKTSGKLESIIPKKTDQDNFTLSHTQRGIYHHHLVEKASTKYHITGHFEITGCLDAGRVTEVFRKLAQRHKILRSSFTVENNVAVQKVHQSVEPHVFLIDESEVSESSTEEPFDLEKAPLYKVGMIGQNGRIIRLFFGAHHIISDGLSVDILMQEFIQLYRGEVLNGTPLQYTDYISWTEGDFYNQKLKEQEKYWLKTFEKRKVKHLRLPVDLRSKDISASQELYYLNEDLHSSIFEFCRGNNLTVSNYLLTAYLLLLHKYSGLEDIAIGITVIGRTHDDMFGIFGPFATLIPFVSTVKNSDDLDTLMHRVQDESIKAFSNQDYPFSELVKKTGIKFAEDDNTLFNAAFSSENIDKTYEEASTFTLDENTTLKVVNTTQLSDLKYLLHLRSYIYKDSTQLHLEYRSGSFNSNTIKDLMSKFKILLEALHEKPKTIVEEIDLISEKQTSKSIFNEENTFNF
jgi:surfactin family lipopeptide synthetase A